MPFGMPMVWRVPNNHNTDLFLYSAPYSKWLCPWRKNQHLCIRIYQQQFGLCLMAMDFLFLNLRTILLHTLATKTVFLQTAKNSSHQLQQIQTTSQAHTPPIRRSQKASSVTSSGISNFQKNKAELLASRLQQWNLLHHKGKWSAAMLGDYYWIMKRDASKTKYHRQAKRTRH